MPRPKLPPEQKRSVLVQVLLTRRETALVDSARQPRQSRADVLRKAFLEARAAGAT